MGNRPIKKNFDGGKDKRAQNTPANVVSSSSYFYYSSYIMKFLAAYLLLVAGGKTEPSAEDITKLLGSVGVEGDEARLTSLLKALEGKSVDEVSTGNLYRPVTTWAVT